MAVMAIHKVPSLTRERYEEVVRRLQAEGIEARAYHRDLGRE